MTGDGRQSEQAELIRFVRRVLGCGCPDDVVARTIVDVSEAGEPGLDVGGRLLVRVLVASDVTELIDVFPETVERLRAERDDRKFNRLRLVVYSVPEDAAEVLREMLSAIAAVDDEIYLHHVDGSQLPSRLIPSENDRLS